VRVFARPEEQEFQFHPKLFECKSRASGILDTAGFTWFTDYSSIDLLHEEFGLEICYIQEESNVKPIAESMRAEFPHWHYSHLCKALAIRVGSSRSTIFSRRCGGGRSIDAA